MGIDNKFRFCEAICLFVSDSEVEWVIHESNTLLPRVNIDFCYVIIPKLHQLTLFWWHTVLLMHIGILKSKFFAIYAARNRLTKCSSLATLQC